MAQRAPDKLVDIIADKCVMEGVGPAPAGNRWNGYDECLAGWREVHLCREVRFDDALVDVEGDRAIVIFGWGVAERPYILPDSLKVPDAAAPTGTLQALVVAAVAALFIVLPGFFLLYVLDQRELLLEEGAVSDDRES